MRLHAEPDACSRLVFLCGCWLHAGTPCDPDPVVPCVPVLRDLGIEVQQLQQQQQQQQTAAAAVSRASTEGPAAAAGRLCPAAVEAMVQRAVRAVLAEQGCAERLGSGDLEVRRRTYCFFT